jgi:adenosine deaminase
LRDGRNTCGPTSATLQKEGVELPAYTVEGLKEKVFKAHYNDLFEYLQGFAYVGQVLQNAENLERVAYECGVDCFTENCRCALIAKSSISSLVSTVFVRPPMTCM